MINADNISCMNGLKVIDVDSIEMPKPPKATKLGEYPKYKYDGHELTIGGYARIYGICRHTIKNHLRKGIPIAYILDELIEKKLRGEPDDFTKP